MKGEAVSTLSLDHGQSLLKTPSLQYSPSIWCNSSLSAITWSAKNSPSCQEIPEDEDFFREQREALSRELRQPAENEKVAVYDEELRLDGRLPQLQWCSFCRREVTTRCSFRSTSKTLWSAVAIFVLGGALGCFLYPYISNDCKQPVLQCTHCSRSI